MCRCARRQQLAATLLSVALAVPAAPAGAQTTPPDVADLKDARASSGETVLGERGYVFHHGAKTDTASYTYWWHPSRRQCIRVQTDDGRYASLVQVSNSDCNQTDKDGGPSTGAKVALGAAALLGVAVLAHKSHHRNDKRYDERQTADFERGYRDALYNHPYHNRDNTREYSEGYSAGADERRQQSSYRYGNEYRGGYGSHVSVSDLDDRDTNYAWGQLERRGFRLAGERRRDGDRLTQYYWNASARQCVTVHTRGQRVTSIRDTDRSDCN